MTRHSPSTTGPDATDSRLFRPPFRMHLTLGLVLVMTAGLLSSCRRHDASGANDPELARHGSVQVTARLVEIPEGAIFRRDLYDYATILKYEVLGVQRGQVQGGPLYVAHYNPWKPRGEAADRRVPNVGGHLRQFQAGQVHHLALDVPLEDHYLGGVVNKYFGKATNTLYWAVWTNSD